MKDGKGRLTRLRYWEWRNSSQLKIYSTIRLLNREIQLAQIRNYVILMIGPNALWLSKLRVGRGKVFNYQT